MLIALSIFVDATDAFVMGGGSPPSSSSIGTLMFTSDIIIDGSNRKISKKSYHTFDMPRGGGGGSANGRVNTRMKAAVVDDGDGDEYKSIEQTISAATFNLIKGCVGSGVLSLPAGVAAIGDVPEA